MTTRSRTRSWPRRCVRARGEGVSASKLTWHAQYPSFACPNIWPTEVPELRSAFMDLGK